MRRVVAVVSILLGTLTMGLVAAPVVTAGAAAPTTTIYDSTDPTASQLPSLAFEATQATEIGDQVQFAPGTSRTLNNVTVSMDSWGCGTSGSWSTGDCLTTPGATFAQPITLNLYNVNADNSPGTLIKSVTQTVNLKYRPSADNVNCTGANAGKWFDGTTCYNGIVTNATLSLGDITVPDKVIYGIEIRTSTYGDPLIGGPLGSSNPCNSTSQGCPYDSLNVALSLDPTNVTVGSDPISNGIYWATTYAPFYCDSGASGSGTFRLDAGCWGDQPPYTSSPYDVPAVQFNAESTCTTVCYVNSGTGNDTNSGAADSPFATIQHAVDTVSSGGTVHVAAGTYNESVNVAKSVVLQGANAGVPGTGARGAESVVDPSPNDGSAGVFTISTASPVTIDGFQSTYVGTDAAGQQATGGLVLSLQPNNSLTFEDNVVTGSQFNNALIFDDSAASSTITGNLFTGTTQYHDNGTGIIAAWGSPSQQANVTITGNTFTGLTETPSSPGNPNGTPVLNINDDGGTISGNTFSNVHEYGILLADTLGNLTITGNSFSGIYNDTPGSSSNRGSGVRLFTADGALDFTGPVSVSQNTFTNMYHAVDVANDGIPANLTSGNFTVNRNSFVGPFNGSGTGTASTDSTAINVASGTVGTLNATCNWWGQVSGPAADQYSGSVTVSPSLFAASPLATAGCGVPGVPAITSASSVTFLPNAAGTFQVTATGSPTPTLSETGALPTGITFNPATGVLSGTATVGGSFPITLTASNGVSPSATQAFTLTVTSNTSAITSAASTQTAVGKRVRFTVTTHGNPAAMVSAAGLPAWMTFTPGTRGKAGTATLSGVGPVGGGDFTFTVHANNGIGPDTTQLFTVHVLAISSVASVNFSKSGPVTQSFTITTTGAGAGVTLTAALGGDEAGLTFHDTGNGTATISGQPSAMARTHLVKVTAQSGASTATQKLAVGING